MVKNWIIDWSTARDFTVLLSFSLNYRKVASSRPVYYSIFDHFWGATNQEVLLSETCYYCYVHQSWIHFYLCNYSILIKYPRWSYTAYSKFTINLAIRNTIILNPTLFKTFGPIVHIRPLHTALKRLIYVLASFCPESCEDWELQFCHSFSYIWSWFKPEKITYTIYVKRAYYIFGYVSKIWILIPYIVLIKVY